MSHVLYLKEKAASGYFLRGGFFPRLVALFPLIFPLYLFKGVLVGVPVTFPELVLAFMFLYFLFDHEPFRHQEWVPLWPVAVFLLAAAAGVLVVPSEVFMVDGREFPGLVKALGIFKGWVLAPLLYFVMARSVFREKPSLIAWTLRALLGGAAVLSVLALVQVVTGEFLTPDGRASGPYESANYLALYLGPVVIYGLFTVKEVFSRAPFLGTGRSTFVLDKIFLSTSTLLCVLALFFTQSYAAFIAVFVALLVGLFSEGLFRWGDRGFYSLKFFLLCLAGFVMCGALAGVFIWDSDKFNQFLDFSGRSSSSVRVQVYQIALYLLETNPFLGIGLGQFEQQYQVVAEGVLGQAPFEWNMLHPHNLFLATWLSMGLAGLLALLVLLRKALLWLFEKDQHRRSLAALMLVVLLIHGLFDTPYFKNDLAFQFWLLLAILL